MYYMFVVFVMIFQWFVAAASGPKAIVMVIDNKYDFENDSMAMRDAAIAVLDTLNQNDYFVVFATNEPVGSHNSLVPGNRSNVDGAKTFVLQLNFNEGTRDPNTMISLAVENARTSLMMIAGSHNYAFILLTDNSFVDPSLFTFTTVLDPFVPFFLANNIRVFNFLFSPYQEATLLKNISCTTGGRYDRLQGLSPLENALRVTSYYHFFASTTQTNHFVWSEKFTDELTGLQSSSVCTPYYRTPQQDTKPFNTLIGVTCITVPTTENDLTIGQQLVRQYVRNLY